MYWLTLPHQPIGFMSKLQSFVNHRILQHFVVYITPLSFWPFTRIKNSKNVVCFISY